MDGDLGLVEVVCDGNCGGMLILWLENGSVACLGKSVWKF